MSNFVRRTRHPETGLFEDATWLDDYFGNHIYGVKFPNHERIYCEDEYEWEFNDPPVNPEPSEPPQTEPPADPTQEAPPV